MRSCFSGRRQTYDFGEGATSAPAELGGEIHPCLAKSSPYAGPSAGTEVAHVYGSRTFGAFWPLGFAPRQTRARGLEDLGNRWPPCGNVGEFGDAVGILGKRCLFLLIACYPEIRLPGYLFAAGSAKRQMDGSSGRSKVGVSSKMRIAWR